MEHKGSEKCLGVLNGTAQGTGSAGECLQVRGREIGQGIGFEAGPEVFRGIEFGCVGWNKLGMDSWMSGEEGSGDGGAVRIEAIPQQDQLAGNVAQEAAQEGNEVWCGEVAVGMQPEAEMEASAGGIDHDDDGDDGYLLMRPCPLGQHGRVSSLCPCAAQDRRHQNPAFVEKNQESLQPLGFFLIRGH